MVQLKTYLFSFPSSSLGTRIKYDEIYINKYSSISDLKKGINRYINFYNHERFHSALLYEKPMNVYLRGIEKSA